MGADNWELVRDLALARQGLSVHPRVRPDAADVLRLEAELATSQSKCRGHSPAPERPNQCLWCSAKIEQIHIPKYEPRPLAKASPATPLSEKKTG